jgi:hypothetical protein
MLDREPDVNATEDISDEFVPIDNVKIDLGKGEHNTSGNVVRSGKAQFKFQAKYKGTITIHFNLEEENERREVANLNALLAKCE